MRYLYLVRHGKVQFDGDVRRCIGRVDVPLSMEGKQQAKELGKYFSHLPISHIFCSPLLRTKETASYLSCDIDIIPCDGLIELDMGEWENVPLSDLHKTLESEPLYGEKRKDGLQRFQKAIDTILKQSTGDIICVAHAGINSCFLAYLLDMPIDISRSLPQPYGCYNKIAIDDGHMEIVELGVMPRHYPTKEQCLAIYRHYHTPENVVRHCLRVCDEALWIAHKLNEVGCHLNINLIESAALLHDVARKEKNHAEKGAKIVIREGYPRLADIILQHHELKEIPHGDPNEIEVVYLADKWIQGDQKVSLKERFEKSLIKCQNHQDALKAHQYRYHQAMMVEKHILDRIKKGKMNNEIN